LKAINEAASMAFNLGSKCFTEDDLYDISETITNLIQDKRNYCKFEEGTDEQLQRLEALHAKVMSFKTPIAA
jgi:hypothetical protein